MATIEIYERKTGVTVDKIPCRSKADAEFILPGIQHQMDCAEFGTRVVLSIDEALPLVEF